MGAGEIRRTDHRAEVMRILDAVEDEEERILVLLTGSVEHLLHAAVVECRKVGRYTLVARPLSGDLIEALLLHEFRLHTGLLRLT